VKVEGVPNAHVLRTLHPNELKGRHHQNRRTDMHPVFRVVILWQCVLCHRDGHDQATTPCYNEAIRGLSQIGGVGLNLKNWKESLLVGLLLIGGITFVFR